MALLKNLDDLDNNGKIGDWCFLQNDTHIAIRYGENAFQGTVVLPINNESGWYWNGNKNMPTIIPSILVKDVPDWNIGWHGFLTDGKLITA